MIKHVRKGAVAVDVDTAEFPPATVKHAAFSLTDAAYAALEPAAGGIRVVLRPKCAGADIEALRVRFTEALREEALRGQLEDRNLGLRDHIIALALRGEETATPAAEEPGLTPEQEKELDRLVAEVEAELGKEPRVAEADPLGVTKTWEETRGSAEDAGS